MTVAALPPYDLPEVRAAMDDWWRGLAEHLRRAGVDNVPTALTRGDDPWTYWEAPNLLIGQTCGYPLVTRLAGKVRAVATPCYASVHCDGPLYGSLIMVHQDDPATALADLAGRRAAFNDHLSHSGYNILRASVAPLATDGRFFAEVLESGSHRDSLAMVRTGKADIMTMDCVSFALVARHAPAELDGTRIMGMTERARGLPYVTPLSTDDEIRTRLFDGLMAAGNDPALAAARDALLLSGFVAADNDDYAPIAAMAKKAAELGMVDLP